VAEHNRSAQTGAYMRMLLVRPGEPRSVWEKHAIGARPGQIDVTAVAEAMRGHGERGYLVEVVRDVLNGTRVDPPTLENFIEVFDLGPRHAKRLRSLQAGSDSVRVIVGDALAELHPGSAPQPYDTLAVHELHTLGPDGLPAEHQTIQVIRSTVDGLRTYPYRFDTDELVVEVVRGGHVGDMYRVTDTLYGVDIVLDRPLAAGETTLMHYRTTFLYRTPPPPEFRRGVMGTMKDVTLWVQFHPDRLPARVWSGRWDRLDHANVIEQQLVEMDGEFSVQVRYDKVEDAIVGFHWAWD
jgi:hypothetical protein